MIVVFGSINLDLIAQVARIPMPGQTLAGRAFLTAPGGKGANQALAAMRAGASVKMFGAVGRDAFAANALANLEASGLDLSGVLAVDAPTGIAMIHVDEQGENAITVIAGANSHARAAQVPDAVLGPGFTLVLQLEVPEVEVARLAQRAKGARVILNAAPALALSDDLLRAIDTLIVNEGEAAQIGAAHGLPAMPDSFAQSASARFDCAVVVTLGPRGALAVQGGESVLIPAPATPLSTAPGPEMRSSARSQRRRIVVLRCDRRWPKASLRARSPVPVAGRRPHSPFATRLSRWQQHFDTNLFRTQLQRQAAGR